MSTQIKFDHNIIEPLLSLLDSRQKNDTAIDYLLKDYPLSERLRTEAQNIQIAYYLMKFTDEMPGGFFIYRADESRNLIYANKAMIRLFNCDSMEEFQELTGNSFRGIVHPDDYEAVEQSIKEQIENSCYDLDYVEYRIIQKGGEIRWIDDYGHFVHSEVAGDIFYVFVGDLTEKKQQQLKEKEALLNINRKKEQQLQDQIEKYDLIHQEHLRRLEVIEGLSIDYESIFYVNLDTNQIKAYRVSNRFEKQFPKDCQTCEFAGFDFDYIKNWVHPDDQQLLIGVSNPEYIRNKLSENKSFHINYRIYKNGKLAYIQLRIVNVGNEEHISQVILGYRNIDDEIIQEMKQKQILTEALSEANLANNAKNLFLSNMSHDIRTPMNAIVGFASLVKRHMDDKEKISKYLDMILDSSDQLLQLLNDVLEISRIESGKICVEEKECSLIDIIQQTRMNIFQRTTAKNISVSLDIPNLKHDIVYADKQKLSQILSCLLDNAVKYTKIGGHITIRVIEQEGIQNNLATYQIVVEDDGVGISKNFLEHIFEPFEREKNTTLSGIYGTGLGLTITKDLVDIIGGTISVSSTLDKGSKFTVTLPLLIESTKNQAPVFPDSSNDTSISFSSPKRILIVDDNEINLEIENEVLKDAGFLVDTAADGSIAVEKVKQSKPGDYDLILMDIQMPVMNGYHATRAIRKIEDPILSSIPIIAVSANTFEEDKKNAIESGMNAHLAKPLDTPLLYQLIQKFIKDTESQD